MAIKKMPIGTFVAELKKAEDRKDGYIMASTGQNPKKWSATSWWFTQYSGSQKTKALYWRENAERVWDCNGLAEGLYKDYSGVDINTKARYNYAQWCDPKGTGTIPNQYKVPGAAVFWGEKASNIHHVAYLVEPVDTNKPEGDWYIIEARGVMYGVVKTKLNSRKPNFWGLMTKYFDYKNSAIESKPSYSLGDRVLKKGMEGEDVKELQSLLTKFGFLNDVVDGEFGSKTEAAVKALQKAENLKTDGQYGEDEHKALMALVKEEESPIEIPDEEEVMLEVTGQGVNIRTGDSTNYSVITITKKKDKLAPVLDKNDKPLVSKEGWYAIRTDNQIGWMSGKYVKTV